MTTRAKRTPPPLADADRATVAQLILDDYRRFLSDPDADSKAFAARHAAGKAALAHLDQLMKVGGPGEEAAGAGGAAEDGHLSAARDEGGGRIMGEYCGCPRGGPRVGGGADSKAVPGRHAAGKGSLAHLEQLFRTAGGTADG